ncbi:sensor domain-containing diguanylate cyclase [Falsiroseomonas selenitidurans]|uniref:diguanylate cyclase n=1 Tax=Falsiroseomonas selenitidurans TaxID=2716335 RepID=A0ABX1DXU5_9PROT|nr:GGDEF domain-containing protein [Falsiroseomonas selenitidurans]NKC29696.1 GGDEF domain-containing protein [Falsiroseomonas selenitidurans]
MDGLTLSEALIESRGRWRDFALLSADLLFETDAEGRFTFLAPDTVLGHPAQGLLGTEAALLLAAPGDAPGPFIPSCRPRHQRAWLRAADGSQACLDFALMPHGEGLRGAARDVTATERQQEVAARALRRATALGRLLRLGQRQGGAQAALEAMLAALPGALACDGAALLLPEPQGWSVAHGTRTPPLHRLPQPTQVLPPGPLALARTEAGPCLLAWRGEGAPPLEEDDRDLLEAMALPMAALRAEVLRQRELSAAAECDALTGLLNRRGLVAALPAARQGVLVFLDLDGLKPLNDRLGHEAGDAALRSMAGRLRAACARADLAARLGGDEFCLWLEDATPADAARRMRQVGQPGPLPGWPEAGPEALRASCGLAVPRPNEPVDALLARADAAMYAAKRTHQAERRERERRQAAAVPGWPEGQGE